MGTLKGDGMVDDNNVFTFDKTKDLKPDDIKGFIDYNDQVIDKIYKENQNMYKGDYPILHQKEKPMNKPDNRIVINFAKYIVDIFNGFFIGETPQITMENKSDNDNLQLFNNQNSVADKLNEIAKQTSKFGRSYLFLYNDENAVLRLAISSPRNSFMIYDSTVAHNPLAFVQYSLDEEKKMSGSYFTATKMATFDNDCKTLEETPHLFGDVPAVEFIENEERQGAFESVKTQMNGINNALSQKANDVEAIADAYFFMKGAELDDENIGTLQDERVLATKSADADAKFLERPNGDGTQENLLDRLEEKLFMTAMVTNLNNIDSGASSTASGYSIELRMQAMRGLASNKERKFTLSLRRMYKMVFSMNNVAKKSLYKKVENKVKEVVTGKNTPNPEDEIKFGFIRNLPKNVADEANTAKTLEGVVSKKTQLKALKSLVDDPEAEIKQMQKEENDSANNAFNNNPANYDFQKSQSDVTVGEDDGEE